MIHSCYHIFLSTLVLLCLVSCDSGDRSLQPASSDTGQVDVQLVFGSQKPAKLQEITRIWITAWPANAQSGTRAVGTTQLQKVEGRGIGLLKLPAYDAYQIRAAAMRETTVVFLGVTRDVEVRADAVSSVQVSMQLAEISGFEVVSLEAGTANLSWDPLDMSPHYEIRHIDSNGLDTRLYVGPDTRFSLPINQLYGESIRATVTNQFFPGGSGIEYVFGNIPDVPSTGATDVSISSAHPTNSSSIDVEITTVSANPPAYVDVTITAGGASSPEETATGDVTVIGEIDENDTGDVTVIGEIDD